MEAGIVGGTEIGKEIETETREGTETETTTEETEVSFHE